MTHPADASAAALPPARPPGPVHVVAVVGDAEAQVRVLEAELFALVERHGTLVLDLHLATFLGPKSVRLLLKLRDRALAADARVVLWRPGGQPLRTVHVTRLDRAFELRMTDWRPRRSKPAPRTPRPVALVPPDSASAT